MSKDVILDRYARLYEIPNQLSLLGHQIECFCLSYQSHEEGTWSESNDLKSLTWYSKSYVGYRKIGILGYPFLLLKKLKDTQFDLIIAASDIPHIAIGAWCAKKLNIPFVADLYDNFEGFGQAKIPGMKNLLRYGVRSADLITTTSQPLADLIKHEYLATGKIFSMPSTVDLSVFKLGERLEARKHLGLPESKILIGTAGGLYEDKGIGAIYEAWSTIEQKYDNVHLVLAGPYDQEMPPPTGAKVHYLGSLAHSDIAILFRALNIGLISILDTPFGQYCFPQKAYEMLACNLSVVVADVGAMKDVFIDYPDCLFKVGDKEDLVSKIAHQIEKPISIQISVDDWAVIINRLELLLHKL